MTGEAQDLEDGDLEGGGLDGQARAWVVRLASGDMTATELAALKVWLADSERHRQAFAEARALWQDLAALEPAFAAAEEAAAKPPRPRQSQPSGRLVGRRAGRRAAVGAALAATLAGAACLLLALFLPQLPIALKADYVSDAAAVLNVTLPDGSRATLDRNSAIALNFDAGRRQVELLAGEAFFEVRPDRQRPFRVLAAGGVSEAVGTAYAVRLSPEGVRVAVTEGRVAVTAAAAPGAAVTLNAGEGLRYPADGQLGAAFALDGARALAWREGRVVFVARPLAEALAELERYHAGRILLLREGRHFSAVSGVIDLDRLDEGLAALAATHGLTAVEMTPYLTVLR